VRISVGFICQTLVNIVVKLRVSIELVVYWVQQLKITVSTVVVKSTAKKKIGQADIKCDVQES
jgi:hypothetical protein